MVSRTVEPVGLDGPRQGLYDAALRSLELVLRTNVVAVVCLDADGTVVVVPGAGIEAAVFEVLREVNWARLQRLAEEWIA